ncbi:MAG TPA: NAD(P)/FAD-dependent oxidoreductase [Candidatus Binatia bacterium]|nr:NAD(P)/FAD-dependent oxidoreductase [Candidatus Binatia bacterium]
MGTFYDVVVIGAGAAGIGAGRRLAKAGVSFVLVEARDRIGGRALTRPHGALDLGCGWLHSGERNMMTAMAEAMGFEVDRTKAPWERQSGAQGMSEQEQAEFRKAFAQFEKRIDEEAEQGPAAPASHYLEPDCRWNPLLNAVFSYISGAALAEIDARDYARYEDTGCNWRVRDGYGALIAALGAGLPVMLEAEARSIDHSGATVRVETSRGAVEGRTSIVTVPTEHVTSIAFTPDLPGKREAASALPLGAAEKMYFALQQPEEFPVDGHVFARTDRAEMGSYHLRPMGRPMIEVYFGGGLARGLVEAGPEAMADFAKHELAELLGSSFPARLTTLATTSWSTDPYARGSYSYAKPGCADMRAVLAAPYADRLFFAGEACSRSRYSTAHGAYETGHDAAEQALASL